MFEEVFRLASALEAALRRCGASGMGLGALVEDARTRGWLRPSQVLALREFVVMRNALAHEAARAPLFERAAPGLVAQAQDALNTLEARLAAEAERVDELDRGGAPPVNPVLTGPDAALLRALQLPDEASARRAEWGRAVEANVTPAARPARVEVEGADEVTQVPAPPRSQPLGWWWWAAPVVAAVMVLALWWMGRS